MMSELLVGPPQLTVIQLPPLVNNIPATLLISPGVGVDGNEYNGSILDVSMRGEADNIS